MAKSVLDILIKLTKQGGADKETVKGLVSIKSAIMGTAAVAGTLVAAGYAIKKVFDETAGVLVDYADQVRRLSDATGAGTEDTSKLIQVLDDLKISYEDIQKAVAKGGKTFDFSIEGIAKMSDAYLELTNTQDRAAFMQERFGKNWISFVPAMERGGQAIRDASEAVDDSLVLTQKAVDQAREYEIAVDNLSDSWLAAKISLGREFLPVVTSVINHFNDLSAAQNLAKEAGLEWSHLTGIEIGQFMDLAAAQREATDAAMMQKDALDQNSVSAEENAAALKLVSEANNELLGLIGKMQSAQESYGQKYDELSADMSLSDDERKAKLAELAAEHDLASKKIILGLLEQRLMQDGLTTEELNFLLEKGAAWGIYSQTVITESRNAMAEVDRLAASVNNIPTYHQIDIRTIYSQVGQANAGSSWGSPSGGNQGHALGGSFLIPMAYGNEGFKMGNRDTASGGEMVTITPKGGGGMGGVNISLTISSPVTIMDEQNVKKVLLPYIIDGIRQAQAKGSIR